MWILIYNDKENFPEIFHRHNSEYNNNCILDYSLTISILDDCITILLLKFIFKIQFNNYILSHRSRFFVIY